MIAPEQRAFAPQNAHTVTITLTDAELERARAFAERSLGKQ